MRTKAFINFTEAGTLIVPAVEASVVLLSGAGIDRNVGIDKVTQEKQKLGCKRCSIIRLAINMRENCVTHEVVARNTVPLERYVWEVGGHARSGQEAELVSR